MNNAVGLADRGGNLTEEYSYPPFGKIIGSQPSLRLPSGQAAINPYLFAGRRYDEESGLYYFRNRYYSPELGRFITSDPILSGDSLVSLLNQTNFARNNYLSTGSLRSIMQ